jgi:small subunit ribosomal protein S16
MCAAGRICPAVTVPETRALLAQVRIRPGKLPKNTQKDRQPERNHITVVMIRLARVGAPKQPYYRIVVIEKDRARNGRSIEVVGTYNPRTNPATVNLKHDRIAYWRGMGAQLSTIMQKLVTKNPAVPTTPAPVDSDPTPPPVVSDATPAPVASDSAAA